MSWWLSWFTRMTESTDVLRKQRDDLNAEVRALRHELRVTRAYIGELEQARERYLLKCGIEQTPREIVKTLTAPVKPERVKMAVKHD